jgi:transposase-like protein
LIADVAEVFPATKWQRCVVHWGRNVMAEIPRSKLKDVVAMLKAIHAHEDGSPNVRKNLDTTAQVVRDGVAETLACMASPREHGLKISTANPLERITREIRDQTHVGGGLPRWPRHAAAGRGPPAGHRQQRRTTAHRRRG